MIRGETVDLYFIDHTGKEWLVEKGVSEEDFVSRSLKDLETRRPNLMSHYQRVFENDLGFRILDFGSHTEFYALGNATEL